jgi:hypothetical protein
LFFISDEEPTHNELLPDTPTTAIPIDIAHYRCDHSTNHTPVSIASFFNSHDPVHEHNAQSAVTQHENEANHLSIENMKRRYRRKHENPERIRELMGEKTAIVENLNTANEGKMDIAAIGILSSIIMQLDSNGDASPGKVNVDSGDRQRALFKAGICPVIATTLR